jgi:aspartyl-tRNA(Asn)/glutamyl-tRNA(Gln) amidotransferase subunit A
MSLYLEDVYTVGVNLAGLPGLTFPAGMAGHLPVGMQLIGPALGEETILRIARMFELARR